MAAASKMSPDMTTIYFLHLHSPIKKRGDISNQMKLIQVTTVLRPKQ
jgi:hypothetical protein